MNMNDLFDRYVNECIPNLSWRSQRDYQSIVDLLRVHFGHMAPGDVKPRHVVNFLEVDKGRIHRNRMVMILSMVFKKAIGKWCVDDELRNPCVGVERWPTKPRTRYVTNEEFAAFRATCPPVLQVAMDLALLTGQRQGDLVNLMWEKVHTVGRPPDKWFIEIKQGKTGKHLGIAITPAVAEVLMRARKLAPQWPHQHVLRVNPRQVSAKGQKFTEDGFRALWQRYQARWIKAGNPGFHFHDLRAKSISDNKNLDAAYLLAGHIDIKMTRRVYDRNIRMVEPLR